MQIVYIYHRECVKLRQMMVWPCLINIYRSNAKPFLMLFLIFHTEVFFPEKDQNDEVPLTESGKLCLPVLEYSK